MKFASLRDGHLLLVFRDQTCAVHAAPIASSLLDALQRWDAVALPLTDLYESLNAGTVAGAFDFHPGDAGRCPTGARIPSAPRRW